jgi:hypothetical protein
MASQREAQARQLLCGIVSRVETGRLRRYSLQDSCGPSYDAIRR